MKKKKILVVIYGHPEYYPPTLNALDSLSKSFSEVRVVHRPFIDSTWSYPENVILTPSGKNIKVKDQENANTFKKIFYHFQFIFTVFKEIVFKNYSVILAYDHLATLSLTVLSLFIKKKTVLWYHNHDVPAVEKTNKYSIGRIAIKTQNSFLKKCDVFTLPTVERLEYFTIHARTKIFILPNYPSINRYKNIFKLNRSLENPKIIYQGTIGEGHGIIETLQAINKSKKLKSVKMCLAGSISNEFKQLLDQNNKEIT